jgi:hypothetical protein
MSDPTEVPPIGPIIMASQSKAVIIIFHRPKWWLLHSRSAKFAGPNSKLIYTLSEFCILHSEAPPPQVQFFFFCDGHCWSCSPWSINNAHCFLEKKLNTSFTTEELLGTCWETHWELGNLMGTQWEQKNSNIPHPAPKRKKTRPPRPLDACHPPLLAARYYFAYMCTLPILA